MTLRYQPWEQVFENHVVNVRKMLKDSTKEQGYGRNASFDSAGGQGTRLESSHKVLRNQQYSLVVVTVSLISRCQTVPTLINNVGVITQYQLICFKQSISGTVQASLMVSIQVHHFFSLLASEGNRWFEGTSHAISPKILTEAAHENEIKTRQPSCHGRR